MAVSRMWTPLCIFDQRDGIKKTGAFPCRPAGTKVTPAKVTSAPCAAQGVCATPAGTFQAQGWVCTAACIQHQDPTSSPLVLACRACRPRRRGGRRRRANAGASRGEAAAAAVSLQQGESSSGIIML
ncbi:hypothetical protein ABPG75_010516 [Micractinium tetrahymenae]